MRKVFVSCLMAILSVAAFGQNELLEVSYANFTYDEDGVEFDDWNTFQIAIYKSKPVSETTPINMEYGIGFNYMKYSDKDEDWKRELNFMSAIVPVRFLYSLQIDNFKLLPFAGVGAKVNLSLKDKETYQYYGETESDTYNWFDKDDMGNDTAKRLQGFWTIGVRAEFQQFSLGIAYNKDFSDLVDDCRFFGTQFSMAFKF